MERIPKKIKILAIGAATTVAIALLVGAIYFSIASDRLERKIAALRAAGQPAALVDLVRKPLPPEANAATYLRRAWPDVKAIEMDFSAAFDAASKADQQNFDKGRLSPTLSNTIQAAFEAHPKMIGLLEQAAACPDYDSELDLTSDTKVFQASLMAQINASRSIVRVLNYQAARQIADGQQEDALRTCLTMFRLCRHFDRDPTTISYLAAIACRSVTVAKANLALRHGPIADTLHAALETELAQHATDVMLRGALSTERAFGLQSIDEVRLAVRIGPIGPARLKSEASDYIDLLDKAMAQAGLPYVAATKSRELYSAAANGRITGSVVPPLQATLAATARVRSELSALRVLNALTLNGNAADAAEPKLVDLGLPAEATVDPYNGGLLHLKKLPDGWLIYAVGSNLVDDGGNLVDTPTSLDVGLGPPTAPESQSAAAARVPESK